MGICNSNGPPTWHLSFIVFGKSEIFFLSSSFFIVCIEYAWSTGYVFSGGANTGTFLFFFSLCVALWTVLSQALQTKGSTKVAQSPRRICTKISVNIVSHHLYSSAGNSI